MSDKKYFSTTKKGETAELKSELRDLDKLKRKGAVKKVIAAMTVGKDVSMLFPDVIQCMVTDDLELKKLVYLYLINYAKTQPDLAILAVNTFVKDSMDPNPLIRALAVRTMGCIRVDRITEYLCDPLQKSLKDNDPYVRKTAAVCVAKLYDISPELVEERGFLDTLRDMMTDSNPMVVSNAVASLSEIESICGHNIMQLNASTLQKLQAALNECTEWGQVFILETLARYTPQDTADAESIIERVTPRMQHQNSAVVLAAIKVIFGLINSPTTQLSPELIATITKKMGPPLVTLLSSESEIQYVALRNINLIIQKNKDILSHEVKVFFCKYNDPIYVKMEKLEIMIKLANEKNIDQVLLEFKEYAQEVDVDFVRRAVRAIGRCAISLPAACERCMNVLKDLIQTKVNYVVQEAVVVVRDVFRRYPNKYEAIIGDLCDNLDVLDENEAKCSMIWIIGEYASRIDNADDLLETFLENFPEETPAVQLQLLTATVKLFLKKPTEGPQKMISAVLSCATQDTDNPDLRDRAFVYWRLLSTDPEAAKNVVLAEKPIIVDETGALPRPLLDELLNDIGSLSSVYHKPAHTFVSKQRMAVQRVADIQANAKQFEQSEETRTQENGQPGTVPMVDDLLGDFGTDTSNNISQQAAQIPQTQPTDLNDMLGGLSMTPAPQQAAAVDPFALPSAAPAAPQGGAAGAAPARPLAVVLSPDKGQGLGIQAGVRRGPGGLGWNVCVQNSSGMGLSNFMVQFNNNSFGLVPTMQQIPLGQVAPGATATASVPLVYNPQKVSPPPINARLQVAVKNDQQNAVHYFEDYIPITQLFVPDGQVASDMFLATWHSLGADCEVSQQLQINMGDVDSVTNKLKAVNMFVLANRPVPGTNQQALYVTGKLEDSTQLLLEFRFVPFQAGCQVVYRSTKQEYSALLFEDLLGLLA